MYAFFMSAWIGFLGTVNILLIVLAFFLRFGFSAEQIQSIGETKRKAIAKSFLVAVATIAVTTTASLILFVTSGVHASTSGQVLGVGLCLVWGGLVFLKIHKEIYG